MFKLSIFSFIFILTKKSDKSIFTDDYMVDTNGKIYASHEPIPGTQVPLILQLSHSFFLVNH